MKKNKLIQSLSFAKMDEVRSNIKSHCSGTFQWLFEKDPSKTSSTTFVTWLQSSESIFWITGKPASGKSTLMNFIYRHECLDERLEDWVKDGTLVRAIVFVRRSAQANLLRHGTGVLRSLVSQMLSEEPRLVKVVKSAWSERYPRSDFSTMAEWSWDQLTCAFKSCLHKKPPDVKLFLMIDGLDEFESLNDSDSSQMPKTREEKDDELGTFLSQLLQVEGRDDIKICLASRPIPAVEIRLNRFASIRIHEHTKEDIKVYTDEMLGTKDFDPLWTKFEPDIWNPRGVISQKIQKKAQGVFMWVFVVVRGIRGELLHGFGFHQIEEKVENAPPQLTGPGGLYEQALKDQVPDQHRDEGLRMLYHVKDLREYYLGQCANPLVLAIAERLDGTQEGVFDSIQRALFLLKPKGECTTKLFDHAKSWVSSCTAGLLEFQSPDPEKAHDFGTFTWTHETVREFLENRHARTELMFSQENGKRIKDGESSTRIVFAFFMWDFYQSFVLGDFQTALHKSLALFKLHQQENLPSLQEVESVVRWFIRIVDAIFQMTRYLEPLLQELPHNDPETLEERVLATCYNYEHGMLLISGFYYPSFTTKLRSRPLLDILLKEMEDPTALYRRAFAGIQTVIDGRKYKVLQQMLEELKYESLNLDQTWGQFSIWHRYLNRGLTGYKFEHIDILLAHNADLSGHLTMTFKEAKELERLAASMQRRLICQPQELWGENLDRACSVGFFVASIILHDRTFERKLPRTDRKFPAPSDIDHLMDLHNTISLKDNHLGALLRRNGIHTKIENLEKEATTQHADILANLLAMRHDLLHWIFMLQQHEFPCLRPGEV
ncbi:hypothetical protein JOL62DRAFT_271386 [Phyllosticta paracitricarpa]|uniref:Nephrocystin 3-like N-terminal domain-containing protein n=1 Tax=Phyllosticta paracitricarpa TaxID=2016321 RepID=A0ABR1MZI6_9PEZI